MRAESVEMKEKFSKGFSQSIGNNNVPIQYARYIRNLRISDKWILPRLWYTEVYKWTSVKKTYGLVAYKKTGRLFRHFDSKFEEVDPILGTVTDRSSWLTLPKARTRYIVYDKYIIILTGTTKPYYFDTVTNTLTLTTTEIANNMFPNLGDSFMWYTILAFQNKLFLSMPITLGNEANCKNRSWTWSQQIVYNTNIIGVISTFDKFWIFLESWEIQYLDQNTINSIGTVANIFSVPFASGNRLLNPDCAVPVWSKLFFITSGMKIRSIWYIQWVAQLQVADISDIPLVGIDWFMQQELDSVQTDGFGFFDDKRNLVKWNLRPLNSPTNGIVVIYDIINTWRLCDDNKSFISEVQLWDHLYAATAYSNDVIYEDEIWTEDREQPIKCVYETHDIKLWQANLKKFWRGAEFWWKINDATTMTITSYVDWVTIMKPLIVNQWWNWTYVPVGIAWVPIAWWSIAWSMLAWSWWALTLQTPSYPLSDFNKVITQSQVRAKWISNRRKIETTWLWQYRLLDFMNIFVLPSKKYRLSDKF